MWGLGEHSQCDCTYRMHWPMVGDHVYWILNLYWNQLNSHPRNRNHWASGKARHMKSTRTPWDYIWVWFGCPIKCITSGKLSIPVNFQKYFINSKAFGIHLIQEQKNMSCCFASAPGLNASQCHILLMNPREHKALPQKTVTLSKIIIYNALLLKNLLQLSL